MKASNLARPVPVDRKLVAEEAARLDAVLRRALEVEVRRGAGDAPIGDTSGWPIVQIDAEHVAPLRKVKQGDLRTLAGLRLEVHAQVADGGSVFVGGYFENRRIVFVLNGARTPNELLSSDAQTRKRIEAILLHEVTHAVDVLTWDERSLRRYLQASARIHAGAGSQRDLVVYYNDPVEVRAYMQMIVAEATEIAPRIRVPPGTNPSVYVSAILAASPTWVVIEPYLRRESRARIYKSVVTALEGIPGSYLTR